MANTPQVVNVRLDRATVAWLDRIATGAATDRGTVVSVLLSLRVDREHVAVPVEAARAATPPRWLSIPEAANALGVHQSAIQRALNNGNLTRHLDGRKVHIDPREVEAARDKIKPRKKRAAKVTRKARKR